MSEKLLEKVFSIKNDKDGRHKVVRVLGAKVKFSKPKVDNIKQKINYLKIMNDKSLQIDLPDDLTLQMAFNNDCNCKCKFCGETVIKDKKDRQVIPEKWLYKYFLQLYPHVANLVPTYGEITYAPEGYKYLSFIHEKFPHINIFVETNGIAFNRKWAELASDNLMTVNFSINAINEDYFKKTVWDKDGVYPVVQKNFDQYLQILKDKGLFAFKPSVSCVLNSSNYEIVEEFVEIYVKKGIQCITFFFDFVENPVFKENKTETDTRVAQTIIKLLEIERILKEKVCISWRLFMPINNVEYFEDIVNKEDIDEIKKKYPEIVKAAEDLDLRKLFKEKNMHRKKAGKHLFSYYEELSGVTFHQHLQGNQTVCSNAWKHLRLRPDGMFTLCSWRKYEENLNKYIKDDKIDWNKFFNSFYYKKMRNNFKQGCYTGCMPNCPGMLQLSKKEYEMRYSQK